MKERDRVARARASRSTTPARLVADGQSHMAPWRTLITAVHPHPSVKINHGATFLVTDQQGAIPSGSAGEEGVFSADTRVIFRPGLGPEGRGAGPRGFGGVLFPPGRRDIIGRHISRPGAGIAEGPGPP